MSNNWYARARGKATLATALRERGWTIHGWVPDRSDAMTDYYAPAHWDGIATKDGAVLVVDLDYGFDGQQVVGGQVYSTTQYLQVGVTWQANPRRQNWHLEREGRIIASGNGVASIDRYDQGQAALRRVLAEIERAMATPAPVTVNPESAPSATPGLVVSVSRNPEKGGIEVKFSTKPPQQILTRLRANGFRYSARQNLWYVRDTPAHWDTAMQIYHAAMLRDNAEAIVETETEVIVETETEVIVETETEVIVETETEAIVDTAAEAAAEAATATAATNEWRPQAERYRKFAVQAENLTAFLQQYHSRSDWPRGLAALLPAYETELATQGWALIWPADSKTGNFVAFFPEPETPASSAPPLAATATDFTSAPANTTPDPRYIQFQRYAVTDVPDLESFLRRYYRGVPEQREALCESELEDMGLVLLWPSESVTGDFVAFYPHLVTAAAVAVVAEPAPTWEARVLDAARANPALLKVGKTGKKKPVVALEALPLFCDAASGSDSAPQLEPAPAPVSEPVPVVTLSAPADAVAADAGWTVIHTYTHQQAVEDGRLIDVSPTACRMGFDVPLFVTNTVWEEAIYPDGVSGGNRIALFLAYVKGTLRNLHTKDALENDLLELPMTLPMVGVHVVDRDGKEIEPEERTLWLHLNANDAGEPIFTLMFPEDW